jgi:hypothetical protein
VEVIANVSNNDGPASLARRGNGLDLSRIINEFDALAGPLKGRDELAGEPVKVPISEASGASQCEQHGLSLEKLGIDGAGDASRTLLQFEFRLSLRDLRMPIKY